MSNKKIGFYFEESLPDVTIPLGDDFSFYYIKNTKIVDQTSTTVNIPLLYLYNKLSNEFIRLSEPDGYYVHKINSKNSHENNIDLSISDILNYNNNTEKALIINGSSLFSKTKNTYFSNFSTTQLLNSETWVSNTVIGNNFGDSNIQLSLSNNVILGQSIAFTNNEITNNIVIGNNLNNLIGNQYKANNNLYVGGTYIAEDIASFQNDNIVQDNIFIKNLGFGNTQKYFQFVSPLKLSVNTPVINDVTVIDKNSNSILIERTTGINKLMLSDFGLDTILGFNNISSKNIKLNSLNIDNKDKNILLTENIFTSLNLNTLNKNIYVGTTDRLDDISLSNVINIGNKSLMNANDSINIGNNNFKYLSSSIVFGNSNNTNVLEQSTNFVNNYVFGDNNFKNYNGYMASNLVFGSNNHKNSVISQSNITISNDSNKNSDVNNTIIVGNNSNNNNDGDFNIILGHNIENLVSVERSGNILIGNYVEKKLIGNDKDKLIIHNYKDYENTTQLPLIDGSFDILNPYLKINGKLSINPTKLPNSNNDITHNKLLSVNSLGEIGYVDKLKRKQYSIEEVQTNELWLDGRTIYSKVFVYENVNTGSMEQGINIQFLQETLIDVGEICKFNYKIIAAGLEYNDITSMINNAHFTNLSRGSVLFNTNQFIFNAVALEITPLIFDKIVVIIEYTKLSENLIQ